MSDDVLALLEGMELRRFAPGETMLQEGPSSGTILVLAEGSAEIRKGDLVVASVSEPGSFLGEISALTGSGHMASVVAREPTAAYVIPDAARAIEERPALALAIARLLARRLNAVTTYLADIKRQYGGEDGHLGMMDEVLSELLTMRGASNVRPGSEREDVPDY